MFLVLEGISLFSPSLIRGIRLLQGKRNLCRGAKRCYFFLKVYLEIRFFSKKNKERNEEKEKEEYYKGTRFVDNGDRDVEERV